MPSQAWKAEERASARLIGGQRYPANTGGLVDCESPWAVVQCKHVQRMSLAELERLAIEAEGEGAKRGKCGVVVVKRRAGRGCHTPRLFIMTAAIWTTIVGRMESTEIKQSKGDR